MARFTHRFGFALMAVFRFFAICDTVQLPKSRIMLYRTLNAKFYEEIIYTNDSV